MKYRPKTWVQRVEAANDYESIEHLDFEHTPECETYAHEQHGDGPATWRVLCRSVKQCGCFRRPVVLVCNGCLQAFMPMRDKPVTCNTCGRRIVWDAVLYVEPL